MFVHSIQTSINIEENENKNNLVAGLYDGRSELYIREMIVQWMWRWRQISWLAVQDLSCEEWSMLALCILFIMLMNCFIYSIQRIINIIVTKFKNNTVEWKREKSCPACWQVSESKNLGRWSLCVNPLWRNSSVQFEFIQFK